MGMAECVLATSRVVYIEPKGGVAFEFEYLLSDGAERAKKIYLFPMKIVFVMMDVWGKANVRARVPDGVYPGSGHQKLDVVVGGDLFEVGERELAKVLFSKIH